MTNVEQMADDILIAADLAGVEANAEAVKAVLTAYKRGFETQPSELRTTNKPVAKRDVNFRYLQYDFAENILQTAYDSGLLEQEDIPAQRIIAEMYAKNMVIGTGVDGDAERGLEKLWACLGIGPLQRFLDLDNIPQSVHNYTELYPRYALTKTNILGSDLHNDTINIYFVTDDPSHKQPDTWRALLEELDFTVPADEILEACATTPSIALTFSWHTAALERVCFYVAYPNPADAPVQFDAQLTTYMETVPTQGDARPLGIIGYTFGREVDYTKLETDYSGTIGLAFQNALTVPMPEPA